MMGGVVLRNASLVDSWPHIAGLRAMCGLLWLGWPGTRSFRKVLA
jgi:hypothetical protein